MRCYICNTILKPEEIQIHPQIKAFEPCGTCLEVISEVFDDKLEEDEVTKLLVEEWGEDYVLPDETETDDQKTP